jgi:hypothetical protein
VHTVHTIGTVYCALRTACPPPLASTRPDHHRPPPTTDPPPTPRTLSNLIMLSFPSTSPSPFLSLHPPPLPLSSPLATMAQWPLNNRLTPCDNGSYFLFTSDHGFRLGQVIKKQLLTP